ncbi:tRNA pseudouridine synthase D [Colletotrichum orchidophilum]|uniref:tRNA pseudouridine synthase D n=1 Tax=Colletotrichum orchidophilum TaxID=1209926 RepID=A0A1G4BBM8_9PEZI|nr:tRNA pseudouridine synthase D [Colletotrichum orchidophilum]OHE98746.1 tRNA pseudouridine synthase D [Colletotrichum orchidophilum]
MAAEVRRSNGTRLDATLGITERIAPSMVAWTGDMRKRYTDFQVYEINKDGSVLHLTETRLPPPPKEDIAPPLPPPPPAPIVEDKKEEEPKPEEPSRDGEVAEKPAVPQVPAEDIALIASLTNEDFSNQLLAIYQTISADKNAKTEPVTSPVMDDKDKRSQLHQNVRRIFNSTIDTTTDPTGAIVARVPPPRGKGKGMRGGRDNGRDNKQKKPKVKAVAPGEGEYLHFTLYKENRDTMDALHQISKALRIKPQAIGTAGTKDRRAATTQRCSVRGQRADALLRARLFGVTVGDYRYAHAPIHLGAHRGNEFVIALKDCLVAGSPNLTPPERSSQIRASVEAAMASMHNPGWINYFGHQRFGTHAVGTHEVGRLLLQGDFEGAVNAILFYDEAIAKRAVAGEVPDQGHARDDFNRHRACMVFRDGGSADEALSHLPRRFSAEASLIRHLGRSTAPSRRDFIGALTSITRGLRNMYLHAYQSYVWNHAASHRWRLYGGKVVEGDLVLVDSPTSNPDADEDDDAESSSARALTASEAASGTYTIHDIVLPSPGHSVAYPTNAVGAFYKDFMRDNGDLDPHDMLRRHREFSLPGAYRKVVVRFLSEPSFEVRTYEDDEEKMHPTDMDRIRAAARAGAGAAGKKRGREEGGAEEPDAASKKAKTETETTMDEGAEGEASKTDEPMADATQTDGKQQKQPEAEAEVKAVTDDVVAEKPDLPSTEKTKTAVVVTFQLPKSAYATVALRELMGVDESEVAAAPLVVPASAPAASAAVVTDNAEVPETSQTTVTES